ncbi:MAG TPA: membrane protein insertase YidC [Pseudonocardia sp.]|uniref:membrane protein insertase YidC n=1 Tax=Pseudonocardia sp. TaxID=60912 RepID=UPI002ED9F293
MLNFIYYPVSWILWFWHEAFGYVFGPSSGAAWALAVVFLVFTLRAILYKPFVHQVRSMRKMQEFAPEIQKLKKKYGNDKQKLAAEMQKLQSEHGVNPVGGCLPMLVQVPVFIGLFHVLREFQPYKTENYVFDRADVVSFNDASIFGAKLGASVIPYNGALPLSAYNTTISQMLIVMIPLMIAAGLFTHITARHSVARQTEAQMANPQAAIMNKLTLYIFPIGVVVGAPFLPLAILFYWVANNLWTLGQQRVVYNKIDREEAEKATQKTETQRSLAPKVGQKPDPITRQKKPGAKPITPGATSSPKSSDSTDGSGSSDKSSGKSGASDGSASSAPSPTNGVPKANGSPPSKKVADESGARAKAGDRPGGQRNGRPSAPTKRGRKR